MGACPRCRGDVALHEGEPRITAQGVELYHRSCEPRAKRVSIAPALVEAVTPTTRSGKIVWASIAASSVIAIGLAHFAFGEVVPPPPQPTSAPIAVAPVETAPVAIVAHEAIPPKPASIETPLEHRYQMPTFDGVPLDEKYPSLRNWVHPVTASKELMPELPARHFGSARVGIDRQECGAGHCGIDLDGPEGRPLVAVADGKIVRIERSELGLDHLSGRYVRIQHDDGTLTAYMHMDDVAEELQVGDRVMAGQYIGTLGATAVYEAPPHCHFSLELPNSAAAVGDTRDTHYIDPAPFLVRSTIAPHAERRHPTRSGT